MSSELVSSAIGMRRTSPGNGHMVLLENYESSLKADAPSASISAGGSLYVLGSDFLNSASYVTASKDIDVRVDRFTNQGATLGKYSVRRSFEHPWLREDKSILSFWRSVMEYNASNDSQYLPSRRGGLQIPSVVDPYIIGMRTGMSRLPILVGKWEGRLTEKPMC